LGNEHFRFVLTGRGNGEIAADAAAHGLGHKVITYSSSDAPCANRLHS